MLRRHGVAIAGAIIMGACVSLAIAAQKVPSKAEQGYDKNGKVVDLKKWFATLPFRLKKDKAKGFTALYDFTVTGKKGGRWWVRVTNQKAFVATKAPKDKPTCVVKVSDEDWLKIVNGELKAMFAYMTGKLKIEGDTNHANKFGDLFF
jgi:putative sterol carrier protein